MAVESIPRRAGPFESDGVGTGFSFSFRVFKESEVSVVVSSSAEGTAIDSSLNYLKDYTVTLNADQENNPGGKVTLLTAPARGVRVTVLSAVQATQETQLTNHDGLSPKILNTVHDKLTILIQQLQEKADRTVVVPASSTKTPDQLLTEILEVADSANDFAQQTKAIYDDVVIRHAEIDAVKEHVDEQATKVDGAIGAIEEARDAAVGVVDAEGDKIKNEVGGLVDNAQAIAQSVANSVSTVNAAVVSASQSATQATNAQNQASQSEQIATQAAQDAAQSAQNSGFAFRFSGSAQANGTYLIQSLTPSINAKVGDHVVSGSGQVFRIVSVTDTSFTLSGVLTSFVGPEGQRGPQGESIVGPEGPRGPQGVPGLQGETGSGLEVLDTFDSENQLPSRGSSGDAYFVGEDLYVWSPSANAWVNKGPIAGGGGITGLMTPDPYTYFLYILNGGEVEDEGDSSTTAQLNYAKLNAMVLA